MIKADIINRVAENAAITKVKAVDAVEAVFDAMKGAMQRGERIELRGFGVFQVKPRKKGIGRNPRTGREVRIPPRQDDPLQAGQEPAQPGLAGSASVRREPVPQVHRPPAAARCAARGTGPARAGQPPASHHLGPAPGSRWRPLGRCGIE